MATMKAAKALTAREIEIVGLVRKGLSNREIAGELGIAEGTVKIHSWTMVPNRRSSFGQLWQ
jgi:DNA-binding NarL/FixJ family response regulator